MRSKNMGRFFFISNFSILKLATVSEKMGESNFGLTLLILDQKIRPIRIVPPLLKDLCDSWPNRRTTHVIAHFLISARKVPPQYTTAPSFVHTFEENTAPLYSLIVQFCFKLCTTLLPVRTLANNRNYTQS